MSRHLHLGLLPGFSQEFAIQQIVWVATGGFLSALRRAQIDPIRTTTMTQKLVEAAGVELDTVFRNRPVSAFWPKIATAGSARSAQKRAREQGNSVFLDDAFVPWADQWAFLASVGKMSRAQVEEITEEAERRGRIRGVRLPPQEDGDDQPWTAPPSRHHQDPPIVGRLPQTMDVILGNQLYISKEGLHPGLRNRLLRLAAFQNPEFYRTQAMRLSTYNKPRIIACADDHPNHISLPRGCLEEVLKTLADLGIQPVIRDERYSGTPLDVTFRGELRAEQRAAAQAMVAHETGVLAATTAFGKTVIAAWLIARRGVSALVLVHRRQLMDQWVERLSAFLGVPAKSIGHIGGGRSRPTGLVDVAIIQSLVRKGVVDDRVADYGHLVVDECHHLSAQSFELVARQAKARFVTGLSATVARKDGHHTAGVVARHDCPVRRSPAPPA